MYCILCVYIDALFDLLMRMVVEPVPADNQMATGVYFILCTDIHVVLCACSFYEVVFIVRAIQCGVQLFAESSGSVGRHGEDADCSGLNDYCTEPPHTEYTAGMGMPL